MRIARSAVSRTSVAGFLGVFELKVAEGVPPDLRHPPARHVAVADGKGRPTAYTWVSRGRPHVYVDGVATFGFDACSCVATAWPDNGVQQPQVIDTYHATALPLGLQGTHDYEAIHASAVLAPRGVAAFCGASEVGKSTTAFELSQRGHPVWADDAVAFEVSVRGSVISTSLPFSLKLRRETELCLRRDDTACAGEPPIVQPRSPLAIVFVLQRTSREALRGEPVDIEQMAASDALVALLPNAYRFRPQSRDRERRVMQSYLELVVNVPVFRLRFVPGLERTEALLDAIEQLLAVDGGEGAASRARTE